MDKQFPLIRELHLYLPVAPWIEPTTSWLLVGLSIAEPSCHPSRYSSHMYRDTLAKNCSYQTFYRQFLLTVTTVPNCLNNKKWIKNDVLPLIHQSQLFSYFVFQVVPSRSKGPETEALAPLLLPPLTGHVWILPLIYDPHQSQSSVDKPYIPS